jgi:diguanylate cyclase (GGDEF)-like protein/PAS domain S-box-containing protein/putative nucleotidyltransferase with HDIG domain
MKKVLLLLLLVLIFVQTVPSIKAVENMDFEDLFTNHQSVMLIIHPITGDIYYANQAAADFYGFPLEILLEMNINQINTLTPEEVAVERLKALEEERNFFIFKHRLSNQDIRTVYVYSYPASINGEIYLYSIIIDQTAFVTEQEINKILIASAISILALSTIVTSWLVFKISKKKREIFEFNETLLESQQRFQVTLQSLDDGVVIHAPDSSIIDFNNRALEILGLSRDQILGKTVIDPIWKFVDEDEKPLLQENYPVSLILADHKPINNLIIGVVKSTNKEVVWAQVKGTPIFDPQENIKEIVISFFDITCLRNVNKELDFQSKEIAKRAAELIITNARLEQRNALIEGLFNNMTSGVAIYEVLNDGLHGSDYVIKDLNETSLKWENKSRDEVVGKSIFELHSNIDDLGIIEVFRKVWKTGESTIIPYRQYLTGSYNHWHEIKIFKLPSGEIVAVYDDITERVFRENQLEKEQRDLLISQKIAELGTWRLDVKTNEVKWSEELYRMYGFDPTQPVPPYTEHMKLFTKKSWDKLSSALAITATQGIPYELELEMASDGFTKGWMWVRGEAEYDDQGHIISLNGAAQNVTKRKQLEENLKEANKIARLGRCELIHNENRLVWSETVYDIFEINPIGFESSYEGYLKLIHPDDRSTVNKAYKDSLVTKEAYSFDYRLLMEDGRIKWVTEKCNTEFDEKGLPIRSVGVVQDITENKTKEEEIIFAANHDPLTNLYNRRYYFEEFKHLNQPQFYPLGLMMLDVNGLKIINDAFGHHAGDEALIMIGNMLKEVFEEKDIISRIGGDEFTVLLPNTKAETLQAYKEKLVENVKMKPIHRIVLSLAIGFELIINNNDMIDGIQKFAENRMYAHKSVVGTSVRNQAINAILKTLTNKYADEKRHSVEVSHLCKLIGIELKLKEDELKELEQAGLFHDIGKISIPDRIIGKPGKLTDEEFDIIKTHTSIGYQILRAADEYSDLAIHALHHHERWDGKGYPSKLKGEDIPLFCRIINVVDAYEAMTADRPYSKKLSKEYAVSEIIRCAGTQFDPNIAKLFVEKVLKGEWTV